MDVETAGKVGPLLASSRRKSTGNGYVSFVRDVTMGCDVSNRRVFEVMAVIRGRITDMMYHYAEHIDSSEAFRLEGTT